MLKFSQYANWVVLIVLVFCMACGQADTEAPVISSEPSDDFRSYPIDLTVSDTKLSDLIDEIEFMRLEETDESLLSFAFRMSQVEDNIIFPGDNDGGIHTFSANGEFVSKFNNQGEGPGQYGTISTTWAEGDSIAVYDGTKQTVHWYDGDGKHLKSERMPERAAHVFPYTGGYALDMTFSFISDSLRYKVLLMDEDMNPLQKLIPYKVSVPFPVTSTVNTFGKYGEKLTFKSPFADTTYLVGAEGAEPFYHIDFGDEYLWADKSLYENGQAGMAAINEGRGVWIFNTFTGSRQVLMTYNTSFRDFGMMLLDRESGEYTRLDLAKNAEETYSFGITEWMEDRLLGSFSSADVGDLISELNENQVTFREGTTLEAIESSENPVLVWVKFRDVH